MNRALTPVMCLIIYVAFDFVSEYLDNRYEYREEQYCDMIQLHEQTAGEYGWSDYLKTADAVCPYKQKKG